MTSSETSVVWSEMFTVKRFFTSCVLLDRICGISFTIGLRRMSMNEEMLQVGLLMCETIGLTLIGCLCSFLRKYISGVLKLVGVDK